MWKSITDLLAPDVWATYIVGFAVIGFGVYQFKRTFKLNKKSMVFEELSKDIQEAIELVNGITNTTNNIIGQLSKAANSANFDPIGKTPAEQSTEIERRMNEIKDTADIHKANIEAIYKSFLKVLTLIKKVEKSTVVDDKSRAATRYLFYAATEQNELVNASSKVLQSFNTTPALGQTPNISSDTFNSFIGLVNVISVNNQVIANYLSDLEVILHNDLVKGIYGKAKLETIPTKHLSSKGLTDTRVKNSLL